MEGQICPTLRTGVSGEAEHWYLLKKLVAPPLVLLQAGKSRSPHAFQGFETISFDNFTSAGQEEGRSVV